MDADVNATDCPLWKGKDPRQTNARKALAWTYAKDFFADYLRQKPVPRCLQGPIQHEDECWINWYYSPCAGGAFYVQGPSGGENITGDPTGIPLSVQERAALSYHIYQHNLYHGWLRRVSEAVRASSSLEVYLQREITAALFGPHQPDNPYALDHLVHLQHQVGGNNWLSQHARRYPTAEARLLSFVGEVIRQADRELPKMPQFPASINLQDERSESTRYRERLNRDLRQRHYNFLWAAGACRHELDFQELQEEAKNRKWLQHPGWPPYLILVPTFAGRLWYEQQTHQVGQDTQAFIAMWFPSSQNDRHDEMTKIRQVMEEAIADAGYSPYCAITDDSISEGIDDEIIAQIRQSRFLIADLTDEGDQGRRNVYYEAGFAYGLGLQVIYTCQRQQFEEHGAAFDIQQRDILQWDAEQIEGSDGFRQRLRNRIEARLGVGPHRQVGPT